MKNILKISLFFTLCRFLPEWFTLGCHVSFLSTVSNVSLLCGQIVLIIVVCNVKFIELLKEFKPFNWTFLTIESEKEPNLEPEPEFSAV